MNHQDRQEKYRALEAATIVCSCGKESRIVFRKDMQQFAAQSEGWIFSTGAAGGWTCGELGHTQADSKDRLYR